MSGPCQWSDLPICEGRAIFMWVGAKEAQRRLALTHPSRYTLTSSMERPSTSCPFLVKKINLVPEERNSLVPKEHISSQRREQLFELKLPISKFLALICAGQCQEFCGRQSGGIPVFAIFEPWWKNANKQTGANQFTPNVFCAFWCNQHLVKSSCDQQNSSDFRKACQSNFSGNQKSEI